MLANRRLRLWGTHSTSRRNSYTRVESAVWQSRLIHHAFPGEFWIERWHFSWNPEDQLVLVVRRARSARQSSCSGVDRHDAAVHPSRPRQEHWPPRDVDIESNASWSECCPCRGGLADAFGQGGDRGENHGPRRRVRWRFTDSHSAVRGRQPDPRSVGLGHRSSASRAYYEPDDSLQNFYAVRTASCDDSTARGGAAQGLQQAELRSDFTVWSRSAPPENRRVAVSQWPERSTRSIVSTRCRRPASHESSTRNAGPCEQSVPPCLS